MLVLTRRPGESIVINGNIRLKIIGLKGGGVKLGVQAPDAVRVDRAEVHELRTQWLAPCGRPKVRRIEKTPLSQQSRGQHDQSSTYVI